MIVGTVREIKNEEYRVGLTPEGAHALVERATPCSSRRAPERASAALGRCVRCRAGATIVEHARGRLVAGGPRREGEGAAVRRVRRYFRDDQTLFTYLHLAAAPELTRALLASKTTAIAYETVQLADGSLPLLIPMSQIAGRMATEVGAQLPAASPGPAAASSSRGCRARRRRTSLCSAPASSAANAMRDRGGAWRAGDRASTRGCDKLRHVAAALAGGATTALHSSPLAIAKALRDARRPDLRRARAGRRSAEARDARDGARRWAPGAVIVDVAIDQGGSFETSRPTTHDDPDLRRRGRRALLRREHARRRAASPRRPRSRRRRFRTCSSSRTWARAGRCSATHRSRRACWSAKGT